jgi:hypothetical protein
MKVSNVNIKSKSLKFLSLTENQLEMKFKKMGYLLKLSWDY